MFKKITASKMDVDQFGIGSVIKADRQEWLVVTSDILSNRLYLLDLDTMAFSNRSITVTDVHFLLKSEVIELVNLTDKNFTFSDFEFNSKGLKRV